MKKQTKTSKKIVLKIPEEIIRKAGYSLKVKGDELKDYIMDMLKKSVAVVKKPIYAKDPIWEIVGLGKSRTGDLSIKHDKYLYRAIRNK